MVALVDHNIGITKDVFVGGPAERILDQVREMCADDELTWFREEDPARLRGEVARHLAVTDDLGDLPGEGSLATDRALVGARLALLPDRGRPDRPTEPSRSPPASAPTWSATSSPRRRRPASGWTTSTATPSWPRCTSA